MTPEQKAEMAREMTGSTLGTVEIIQKLMHVPMRIRQAVCPAVHSMIRGFNLPYERALPLIRSEFRFLASEQDMDPAVLFWIYMEWVKQRV